MSNENWQEDYDWQAAFEYAGYVPPVSEGYYSGLKGCGNSSGSIVESLDESDAEPFGPYDVELVYKMDEGENDERDWIMWGKLKDGRHFFLSAGCDYTGWDCRAGGNAYVAATMDRLIHSAMDIEHRRRFGLPSEGDSPAPEAPQD